VALAVVLVAKAVLRRPLAVWVLCLETMVVLVLQVEIAVPVVVVVLELLV
jgi:hypothetical protein